jgi:hypothetical protein
LGLGTLAQQNANAVSISGGTITDIVALTIADGGTGATSAAAARTNFGLGTISTQNFNAVNITGGSITGIAPLAIVSGGTGTATAGAARIALGILGMGEQDPSAVSITGGTLNGVEISNLLAPLTLGSGGTGATTSSDARINLGLGTMSTQNGNLISITGGSITGINPLTLTVGGTGAATASGARTNLGLGTLAVQNANDIEITGGFIYNLDQPITLADGGTGANTAGQARTNLGLASGATTTVGTMATQDANNVSISGGIVSGLISPLAILSGGTGASTAAQALVNFGGVPTNRNIATTGGLQGGGGLANDLTLSITGNSNGYGTRTISTDLPAGGVDGDIWYQI